MRLHMTTVDRVCQTRTTRTKATWIRTRSAPETRMTSWKTTTTRTCFHAADLRKESFKLDRCHCRPFKALFRLRPPHLHSPKHHLLRQSPSLQDHRHRPLLLPSEDAHGTRPWHRHAIRDRAQPIEPRVPKWSHPSMWPCGKARKKIASTTPVVVDGSPRPELATQTIHPIWHLAPEDLLPRLHLCILPRQFSMVNPKQVHPRNMCILEEGTPKLRGRLQSRLAQRPERLPRPTTTPHASITTSISDPSSMHALRARATRRYPWTCLCDPRFSVMATTTSSTHATRRLHPRVHNSTTSWCWSCTR